MLDPDYMLGFLEGMQESQEYIDEHAEEIYMHFILGMDIVRYHGKEGGHDSCDCVKKYLDWADIHAL
jgi:hypothetical protein